MKLILFRGRPGVGKSTLADEIAKRHGWPVFHKDDVYDTSPNDVSHEERNTASYEALEKWVLGREKTDPLVVLDYPFQNPAQLREFKDWLETRNVELLCFLITCSDHASWAKRFEEREIPNRLIKSFDELKKAYGDPDISPEPFETVIDTALPLEDSLAEIEKRARRLSSQ